MASAGTSSPRSAWRASLEAHSALLRLFERELERDCAIPLSWYDVLLHLWLAPGHALRMSELADSVLLSRSWLTRRVEQMERAGLVERADDDDDGRCVLARLTPAGRRAFVKAERSHARSIAEHVDCHLSPAEAEVVATCFDRIAAAARASRPGPPCPTPTRKERHP